jgi:hypothetical protein
VVFSRFETGFQSIDYKMVTTNLTNDPALHEPSHLKTGAKGQNRQQEDAQCPEGFPAFQVPVIDG